jgi:ribosomal protein S18 acetylase RimI-like enzyme
MTVSTRRVWRAATPTLVIVWIFAVLAAVAIPILAYLIYTRERMPWLSMPLLVVAGLGLLYAWRFGLHPRIRAEEDVLRIDNPFKHHEFAWDDITLIAPGENGLLVGSEDQLAEAWCVQKSNAATKRGKVTRADRIASERIDILEQHNPPITDDQTGLQIRRARPDEAGLLTRMERAASEAGLAHIFPPAKFPYPTADIAKRWRRLLLDRFSRVYVLDLFDAPVGYVAFNADTILHLGIVPQHRRRGYGSALLEFASLEIFDSGVPAAQLWVLLDNQVGRAFYRSHGWRETDDRRNCIFPPGPRELRMVRRNPAAPRRSR